MMRVTTDAGSLLTALRSAYRSADTTGVIEVLSRVLLCAEGDVLSCRATDTSIDTSTSIKGDVAEPGSAVVSARMFYNIARSIPRDAHVLINAVDDKLKIVSGRSRFELETLPASDFPAFIEHQYSHSFDIKVGDLERLIEKTAFAMVQKDDLRYYLEGVFLHVRDNMLRAVATDGHRMALAEIPSPDTGLGDLPEMIIPRKAVFEALARCKTHDGEGEHVEISASPSRARFTFGDGRATMTSRLIDSIYPEYERLIPREECAKVTVCKKDILGALERVSKVCVERKAVKISIEEGILIVSSVEIKNTAVEEIDMVDCDGCDKSKLEIGMNPFYVLEAIERIDGNNVLMKFVNPASPVVLQESVAPYCGLSVIMPMRL